VVSRQAIQDARCGTTGRLQGTAAYVLAFALGAICSGCSPQGLTNSSGVPKAFYYKPLANLPATDVTFATKVDVRELSRFLEENPNNITAFRKRGWQHAREGRYKEAVADLTEAIRLSGNGRDAPAEDRLARLYACRGAVHWTAEDYDAAIADYTQAIRSEPENWELYFHRWQAHRSAGNEKKAEADRQRGAELKPEVFGREYSAEGGLLSDAVKPRRTASRKPHRDRAK